MNTTFSPRHGRFYAAALLCIACGTASASIVLSPNTLLVADRTNTRLRQLDALTGAEVGSVQMPQVAGRTVEGVTILGTDVYACFSSPSISLCQVQRVNLQTGATTPIASVNSPIGLGTRDGDLINVSWGPGPQSTVQRITPAGTILQSLPLLTAPNFVLGEQIDDIAWDGSAYVSVSSIHLPNAFFFDVYRWNPTTGQPIYPIYGIALPASGMIADGFDIAPDGAYWITYNPPPTITGTTVLERYMRSTGQRQRFEFDGSWQMGDVAFVSIPSPGVLVFGLLCGSSVAGRRSRRTQSGNS